MGATWICTREGCGKSNKHKRTTCSECGAHITEKPHPRRENEVLDFKGYHREPRSEQETATG